MSDIGMHQAYIKKVLGKIKTVVERGERILEQIPEFIKKGQEGKISAQLLAELIVDDRIQTRRFGTTQAVEMAKISHTLLYAAEEDGRLPAPDFRKDLKKRVRAGYTINQINHIRNVFNTAPRKPEGENAAVIGFLNLKGGSQKTTHCHLASQYFASKGYRVLILDSDPQGTLSLFFGKRASLDVNYEDTIAPYLLNDDGCLTEAGYEEGASESLHYAIQETYWNNIDIIPACLQNLSIDLMMTSVMDESDASVEDRVMKLRRGLEEVGKEYDFIFVDGTPSLNLSTLNVVSACDMVFVPTPAAMPDYASTLQFAGLVAETIESYEGAKAHPNVPDVRYFITKYSQSSYAHFMADIIRRVFTVERGDVLTNESYQSDEIGKSTNSIKSIYEINPSEADNRKRLKKTVDMFNSLFDEMHEAIWDTCFFDKDRVLHTDKMDVIMAEASVVEEELRLKSGEV